jgi:hypothetical protein
MGVSQHRLARDARVHQSVISRFERGLRPRLSATAVARLLVAIGACPAALPDGHGDLHRVDVRTLDELAADSWYRSIASRWNEFSAEEQLARIMAIFAADEDHD